MILIVSIVFAIYCLSMIFVIIGMRKLSVFTFENYKPTNEFSIIIPFRNEEQNLPSLLKTLEQLKYPKGLFEVIFVDDYSEDSSEEILNKAIKESKLNIRLIPNQHISNSPKKDAISLGIKKSNFDWIVTTDADCSLPENWLNETDTFIQREKPVMIAAPVLYESNGSFLQDFQQLDGLSLQAVGIASFGFKKPLLCNGANMAYKKKAFYEVDGFSGNDHIASGDDIFILEKMKKIFPKQVKYLSAKQALVITKPQDSWKNIINQRIRWASKTSKQKNVYSILLGILVFVVNILMLVIPFLILFNPKHLAFYLGVFFLKIIADYIVLRHTVSFFEVRIKLGTFLLQIYIYAIITVLVVFGSFRKSYSWKGRKFKSS